MAILALFIALFVTPASLPESPTVDQVLAALDTAGQDLRTLQADVTLTEADPAIGPNPPRQGTVFLRDEAGRQQVRVILATREVDGRQVEDRIEYLIEQDKVIERNYPRQVEVTRTLDGRQVGQDLFRLGSGPVPLLIGQDPAEVKQAFDAQLKDPSRRDPEGTVGLRLTPRPEGGFAEEFAWVDVWVSRQTGLPARVRTLDANQTTLRTTDLGNLKLNAELPAGAFTLPAIDNGWQRIQE